MAKELSDVENALIEYLGSVEDGDAPFIASKGSGRVSTNSFDTCPSEIAGAEQCPECENGTVELTNSGAWECDKCNFSCNPKDEQSTLLSK